MAACCWFSTLLVGIQRARVATAEPGHWHGEILCFTSPFPLRKVEETQRRSTFKRERLRDPPENRCRDDARAPFVSCNKAKGRWCSKKQALRPRVAKRGANYYFLLTLETVAAISCLHITNRWLYDPDPRAPSGFLLHWKKERRWSSPLCTVNVLDTWTAVWMEPNAALSASDSSTIFGLHLFRPISSCHFSLRLL